MNLKFQLMILIFNIQIDQGLFDFDPDFSKLYLVFKEPLLQVLDRRYDLFFSLCNSPEPLKLRIVRASGTEIKLELQVVSFCNTFLVDVL
jgi:hypothetical protein